MMFFKNIFSFALTWKGYDWLVASGSIKPIFIAIGSAQVGVCLLTIPLCKTFSDLRGLGIIADMRRFVWKACSLVYVEGRHIEEIGFKLMPSTVFASRYPSNRCY
jgi:hypothetical protein